MNVIEQIAEAPGVRHIAHQSHGGQQLLRIKQGRQLSEDRGDIVQIAGGSDKTNQVHGGGLRRRCPHSPRRRFDVYDGHVCHVLAGKESDSSAPDCQWADRSVSDNLKLLGLLMRGPMLGGRLRRPT